VRDVLHQARRRRLLTKPPQGKAGGRLTSRAIRIFDDVSKTSSREPEARGRRRVPHPRQRVTIPPKNLRQAAAQKLGRNSDL
jgi:hypothetical protein